MKSFPCYLKVQVLSVMLFRAFVNEVRELIAIINSTVYEGKNLEVGM